MLSTVYQSAYKNPGGLPPLKFKYFISFEVNTEDKLIPRCFPHYALHISPQRKLDYERSSVGFGPNEELHEARKRDKKEKDPKNDVDDKSEAEENEYSEDRNKKPLDVDTSSSKEQLFTKDGCFIPKLDGTSRAGVSQRRILYRREERDLYHSVSGKTGNWRTETVSKHWEIKQQRCIYLEPKPIATFLWNKTPSIEPVPNTTFVPKLPTIPRISSGRCLVLSPT